VVTRKRKKKTKKSGQVPLLKLKPSKTPGKAPADLLGVCFNWFSEDHISRFCPDAACCFRCREPGHQAHDCSRPRLPLGDKRPCLRGSGSRGAGPRHRPVALPRLPLPCLAPTALLMTSSTRPQSASPRQARRHLHLRLQGRRPHWAHRREGLRLKPVWFIARRRLTPWNKTWISR
jgi:hypothetical protein